MTMRLSTMVIAFAAMMASGIAAHGQTPKSIRIGYAISLSGPNAPGAGITTLPNYHLWVKEVNAAGGIMLKSTTGATIIVNDTGIYIQNGKGASIIMTGPTVTINAGALVVV